MGMDCLFDTVDILGCGTSASGLFINSLPGMSLASIESLSDAEQKNYLGVWSDVKMRASRRMSVDIAADFSKRYKLKHLLQSYDFGKVVNTTNTTASAAEYRGVFIDLDWPQTNTDFKASALQSHYIQTIQFYSPAIKNGAEFKVWDYDTNTVLSTFTKNLVTGWNYVTVNTSYTARRIVVAVDHTTFTAVEFEINDNIDCCTKFDGCQFGNSADVRTLTKGNNTFGMSLIYGVHCSYDTIVCNNLNLFTTPWLYLLGSELSLERMFSNRINRWTLKQKEAEDMKAYCDEEYEKSRRQVVDSTSLDLSDLCLECDAIYNVKESPFH